MTLSQIDELFQLDREGASEEFEAVRNAVRDLHEISFSRNNVLPVDVDEIEGEKIREHWERTYALAFARAKAAATAYNKSHKGSHILEKGRNRFTNCRQLLEDVLPGIEPNPQSMGIGDTTDLDDEQVLALAVLKEGEAFKPDYVDAEELKAFIDEHSDLDELLKPADDAGFLMHYAEHRQILVNLSEYVKKSDPDLAAAARIYGRYFETRAKLISTGLYQTAKAAKVDLDDKKAREEFFRQHPEFTLDQRNEYDLLTGELKRLQKEHIAEKKWETAKRGTFKQGRLGSKTAFFHGSFLKGTFNAAHKDIGTANVGIGARLGKIGARLKTKYFKLSTSVNAGGFSAIVASSRHAINAVNHYTTPGMGVAAKANAYGLRGKVKIRIGSKKNNVLFVPTVELGTARAAATASLGMVAVTRGTGDDAVTTSEAGVALGASAGVSAVGFGGDASISLFGIKINLNVASTLGVSAKAGFTATSGMLSISLGAALGIGGDFTLSIDWSGLKEKFTKWRQNRARLKQERRENDIRNNLGRSKKINQHILDLATEDRPSAEPMPDDARTRAVRAKVSLKQRVADEIGNTAAEKKPIYQKILNMAADNMGELAAALDKHPEQVSQKLGDAMAPLVLANLIRVQRAMQVPEKYALETAIRDDKQLDKLLQQLKTMNERQPKEQKFWTNGSKQEVADSITQANLNRVTKFLLSPRRANIDPPVRHSVHNDPQVEKIQPVRNGGPSIH